jgi:hypothetical protein
MVALLEITSVNAKAALHLTLPSSLDSRITLISIRGLIILQGSIAIFRPGLMELWVRARRGWPRCSNKCTKTARIIEYCQCSISHPNSAKTQLLMHPNTNLLLDLYFVGLEPAIGHAPDSNTTWSVPASDLLQSLNQCAPQALDGHASSVSHFLSAHRCSSLYLYSGIPRDQVSLSTFRVFSDSVPARCCILRRAIPNRYQEAKRHWDMMQWGKIWKRTPVYVRKRRKHTKGLRWMETYPTVRILGDAPVRSRICQINWVKLKTTNIHHWVDQGKPRFSVSIIRDLRRR